MEGWRAAALRAARALTAAVAVLAAAPASGTWSLVAVDPATRDVGVAVASCIGDVDRVAGLAPGNGAIVAQALGNENGRDRGVEMLMTGASPSEVIDTLASVRFDLLYVIPVYWLRQYGVAALGHERESAAYTGRLAIGWDGDRQGYGVSVQGNLLQGPEVVEQALAAFESTPSTCPHALADRLLAGLEAGAAEGGDRRCPWLQSALSAYLAVSGPDDPPGEPRLRIVIPEQERGGPNPVELLRDKYDSWRAARPGTCGDVVERSTPGGLSSGELNAPQRPR